MTGNTYMPLDLEHGRTLCHFEQRQYWGFHRISWIWVTARHFQIQWPVTQWLKETPSTSNHLYNASCSMKLNQSLFLVNNGDKGVLFRKILRLIFRHLGFFRTYNAVWEENKILVPSLFAFHARVMLPNINMANFEQLFMDWESLCLEKNPDDPLENDGGIYYWSS